MTTDTGRKRIWGLHPNIFFLGLGSLLTDVSSEMIFTLVPLFLANVLGAPTTIIGFISGLSDSTDAVFRIFSGWISDRLGKRKSLAVLGYSLSTIAKPFMYLATSWGATLGIRFADRVGKGIRTSPRDALIAGSVGAGERGKSFGVHRAMDSAGAFLGLALAAFIIYHLQGGGLDLTRGTYRWLVLVGTVPAVLAILVLIVFVHESAKKTAVEPQRSSFAKVAGSFNTRFKVFLAIVAVFTLGNSGEFFIILRAQNLGVSVLHITLMLVFLNAVYVAFSVPSGILSDKLGRRRIIALGWLVYALVFLGFALAASVWQIWLLFGVYGIYHGVVEGAARAFVADLVGEEARRGTAYGLYHGVSSLFLLPAGVIAGWMWSAISPAAPFYFGGALSLLAMVGILAFIREPKRL